MSETNKHRESFVLPDYIPKRDVKKVINSHVRPENKVPENKKLLLKVIYSRQVIMIEYSQNKYRVYGAGATVQEAILDTIFNLDFPEKFKSKADAHKSLI